MPGGKPDFNISFNVNPPGRAAAAIPSDLDLPHPSYTGLMTAKGKALDPDTGDPILHVEDLTPGLQLSDAIGEANAHTGAPDFVSDVLSGLFSGTDGGLLDL